jgi:hypothetical protein
MDLIPIGDRSLITPLWQISKVSNTSLNQMLYIMFCTTTLHSTGKFPFPYFFLCLPGSGILGLSATAFKDILQNHHANGDATTYQ